MDTRSAQAIVTIEEVREAARRLDGVAHRTPVVTSRTLNERAGGEVFLKCENLQRMGAFKFRGAYNRIVQLSAAERRAGVVAFSSGNHAQGVGLASKLLGVPAVIVMPEDAPKSKIAATRDYGAEIVFYDRHKSHRAEIAQKICQERGATLVPPFNDRHVVAGAGTAALELLEDVEGVDAMIAPVGGGGLLSGTAIAAHGFDADAAIYGVEPEAGNDFQQSLERGEIVHIDVPRTIADGLQTQAPGDLTFATVRAHNAGIVTVTDDELRDAMRFAFERLKLVIEPSGAAGLAAALTRKIDVTGKRAGIIISGGNVDVDRFADLAHT
ncbi:MAG TPA: threo-3-hydroxy-L-aspartate ammonia-lyase [Candidatus Baltobacteraceae bacterium]|nr:threo-3-hydroxy-L-aspartate ammonia-lyase [Candidatus Baltobacteraceae bacterium]